VIRSDASAFGLRPSAGKAGFLPQHPVLALASSSVFFASMALLARIGAARGFSAAELVFVRMGIGAICCVVLFASGRANFEIARSGTLLARGVYGSISILLYFFAIARLPVGEATLLNYSSPLFTLIFAMLFLGERPGLRPVAGLAVTLSGLALTVEATSTAGLMSWGVLAGLGSAVMSGAAIATIRSLRRTSGPTMIFFTFCLVAMVISAPLAAPSLRLPAPRDLALLMGIGLTSTVAQLLFTAAMGHLSAVGTAVASPLTPVTAYLLGTLFLGEPLTPRIAAGGLIALGGVVLGAWQARPVAAEPD
jgi:drug/metabolite transporter (DMT)-like permease